jgi:hypothetical protein
VCALTLLRRRCSTVVLFRAGRLSQQLAVRIICCKCICSTLISGPKSSAHCGGCFHIEFVLTLVMLLVHHKGDLNHRVCFCGGLLDSTKVDSGCPIYSALLSTQLQLQLQLQRAEARRPAWNCRSRCHFYGDFATSSSLRSLHSTHISQAEQTHYLFDTAYWQQALRTPLRTSLGLSSSTSFYMLSKEATGRNASARADE